MKKLYRRIHFKRATFMKKVANQILPISDSFTTEQKKAINAFYVQNLMPALQLKHVVLKMSDAKLNQLYFKLKTVAGDHTRINGSCLDEKLEMGLFCTTTTSHVTFSFKRDLQTMYETHPAFKE